MRVCAGVAERAALCGQHSPGRRPAAGAAHREGRRACSGAQPDRHLRVAGARTCRPRPRRLLDGRLHLPQHRGHHRPRERRASGGHRRGAAGARAGSLAFDCDLTPGPMPLHRLACPHCSIAPTPVQYGNVMMFSRRQAMQVHPQCVRNVLPGVGSEEPNCSSQQTFVSGNAGQ